MRFKKDDDRKITDFKKSWISDGSGDASVDMSDFHGYEIVAFQTVPGEDGDLTTDLPSADYNLTLEDSYGMDWLFTKGLTRSGTVAEAFCRTGRIPVCKDMSFEIADAGAAKQGIINFWIA